MKLEFQPQAISKAWYLVLRAICQVNPDAAGHFHQSVVHYCNWAHEAAFLASLTSEDPSSFTWIPNPMPELLKLEFEAFLRVAGVSSSNWAYWTGLNSVLASSYYLIKNDLESITDLPIESLLNILTLEGGLNFPAPEELLQPPVLEAWQFQNEPWTLYEARVLASVRDYRDSVMQTTQFSSPKPTLERHARWLALNLSAGMSYSQIADKETSLGNDENTVKKACQALLKKLEMTRPKGRPRKGETNGATR